MGDQFAVLGRRLPRIDAEEKARGSALYVGDLKLPGMLVGKILRSPIPHGRILNIDVSRARALPGVRAVLTAQETPRIKFGVVGANEDQLPLQDEKVRYIGDEVAAVAAIDEDRALEALSLIRVDYEPLPAVFDPEEAMQPGAPILHEACPDNVAKHFQRHFGDVEEALARADYVFEDKYQTSLVSPCPMEPHGCLSDYSPDGKLTVWASTQNPFPARNRLAKVVHLPIQRVRLINCTIGGAFGSKIDIETLEPITALLSMATGKPVRVLLSREEYFITTRCRHPLTLWQRTAVSREGGLQGRDVRILTDNGAYSSHGPRITSLAANTPPILYRNPAYRLDAKVVYTNNPYGGAYQGYGNPQAAFAQESHFNRIAHELGIDPVEFRLLNCSHPGDRTVSGAEITSCALRECIVKAAEAIGWREKRGRNETDRPHVRRGLGFSLVVHSASATGLHGPANYGEAIVRLQEDGSLVILSGTAEMGQGLNSALAAIAAERVGVNLSQVKVVLSDTDVTPPDLGVYANRGTFVTGNAVYRAASQVREQLLAEGSEILECSVEDLEAREGSVYVRSSPERGLSIRELASRCLYERGTTFTGRGFFGSTNKGLDPKTGYGNYCPTYIFGAQAVEVEVDTETGHVRVLDVVSAHDVGRLLHPLGAEGQVEGAVSRGLGYALSEELVLDEGKVLNPALLNYRVPLAEDMPRVRPIFVEEADPEGPFGAKGVAEPAQVPTAPAIQEALFDALGIRLDEIPFTPLKVLRAIERRGARRVREGMRA